MLANTMKNISSFECNSLLFQNDVHVPVPTSFIWSIIYAQNEYEVILLGIKVVFHGTSMYVLCTVEYELEVYAYAFLIWCIMY